MVIVAIAWIYVVLMMSITEESVVAGVITFLLYGVFPLSIILYVMGAPKRRQRRLEAEKSAREAAIARHAAAAAGQKLQETAGETSGADKEGGRA